MRQSLKTGVSRLIRALIGAFEMWLWKRDPSISVNISVPNFSFLPLLGQIRTSPLGLGGLNEHELIPLWFCKSEVLQVRCENHSVLSGVSPRGTSVSFHLKLLWLPEGLSLQHTSLVTLQSLHPASNAASASLLWSSASLLPRLSRSRVI